MPLPRNRRTPIHVVSLYAIMHGVTGFALFYNLGDRLFWSDEAETACLAVNITQSGLPRTWDGHNVLTLMGAGVDAYSKYPIALRRWTSSGATSRDEGKGPPACRARHSVMSVSSCLTVSGSRSATFLSSPGSWSRS